MQLIQQKPGGTREITTNFVKCDIKLFLLYTDTKVDFKLNHDFFLLMDFFFNLFKIEMALKNKTVPIIKKN